MQQEESKQKKKTPEVVRTPQGSAPASSGPIVESSHQESSSVAKQSTKSLTVDRTPKGCAPGVGPIAESSRKVSSPVVRSKTVQSIPRLSTSSISRLST